MAMAKRTSKNQPTPPKAMVDQDGSAEPHSMVRQHGRIALTHAHPGAATAVRAGLSRSDPGGARHQPVGLGLAGRRWQAYPKFA